MIDEFESVQDQFATQIVAIMDAHQWHPKAGACECGRPVMDWFMWRHHVVPLLALVPLEVWSDTPGTKQSPESGDERP